jgi:hypothetical protein
MHVPAKVTWGHLDWPNGTLGHKFLYGYATVQSGLALCEQPVWLHSKIYGGNGHDAGMPTREGHRPAHRSQLPCPRDEFSERGRWLELV